MTADAVNGAPARTPAPVRMPAPAPADEPPPFGADVIRLCTLQSQLARARTNQPDASARLRPTRRWHAEMERLLRVDGRTPEQVEQVIRWVDGHHFWAPNVLTVETLRKHFDRFAAAVNAERPPARDRGSDRRTRAAVAFAELLRPGAEEIEGRVVRDAT